MSFAVPAPSVPVVVFIKFIANKFIVANLAACILSVPEIVTKFVATDLAVDDLISVSALPCVFGADCKVVAASVELLAVAFLLALLC